MKNKYCVCGIVRVITGWAQAQSNPATLSIVPIGGNEVSGVQTVTVEVFFTANAPLNVEGGGYDLPCTVMAAPGSGTMTVQSMTTDPQNDGTAGPSTNGTPYLFGITGLGPSAPATCITANAAGIGQPYYVYLYPGDVRYIGTYVYLIDDCAEGDFTIGFECTDQPGGICSGAPESTNTTRYREDNPPGPGQGALIPLDLPSTTLTIPVGQCCDQGVCVSEGLSESCCQMNYPDALWVEGGTCLDACPDCTEDAHCDDGHFCNGQETCNVAAGLCELGTFPSCPGDTDCQSAFCDPGLNSGSGACDVADRPNGTGCGNPNDSDCDHPDTCLDGTCRPNLAPNGAGCGSSVNTECDNPDSCLAGMCRNNWETNGIACGSSADTACDNPDTCLDGGCNSNFASPGTPCGSPVDTNCDNPDGCDGSGSCNPNLVADGTTCQDGSACTINDACDDGSCAGTPRICDDGLFCNGAESCDPATGCVPGTSPCPPDFVCDEDADGCASPAIPTVSGWGMIVLVLTLLTGAKIGFSRHRGTYPIETSGSGSF